MTSHSKGKGWEVEYQAELTLRALAVLVLGPRTPIRYRLRGHRQEVYADLVSYDEVLAVAVVRVWGCAMPRRIGFARLARVDVACVATSAEVARIAAAQSEGRPPPRQRGRVVGGAS